MNRRLIVSYEVPDAWESWVIALTDEGEAQAPDEITEQWLYDNLGLWEYEDLKDRGGTEMNDLRIEDQL
ncbi:MAG: hypothetical protein ACWGQW_02325 [bacterium]